MLKLFDCYKKVNYLTRTISTSKSIYQSEKKFKRKVKETVELVQLVDENDKILGLKTKTESEKLAKKLNLSLERVHDIKYGTAYPAYKLFTSSDLLKEEKKKSNKELKKLPLNSRISDHDLATKLQTIRKWLAKNCEIHIAIMKNNEPESMMDKLMIKVQNELKNESRILDIRKKETVIKFIVMPPKVDAKKNKEENNKEDLQTDKESIN